MQIDSSRFLIKKRADAMRDIINCEFTDPTNVTNSLIYERVNLVESFSTGQLTANPLQLPFGRFEQCSWYTTLMRVALAVRQKMAECSVLDGNFD